MKRYQVIALIVSISFACVANFNYREIVKAQAEEIEFLKTEQKCKEVRIDKNIA